MFCVLRRRCRFPLYRFASIWVIGDYLLKSVIRLKLWRRYELATIRPRHRKRRDVFTKLNKTKFHIAAAQTNSALSNVYKTDIAKWFTNKGWTHKNTILHSIWLSPQNSRFNQLDVTDRQGENWLGLYHAKWCWAKCSRRLWYVVYICEGSLIRSVGDQDLKSYNVS